MEGMVKDISSFMLESIPKSIYVCPVVFHYGQVKDLQWWWSRYPPDMVQKKINAYVVRHLDKLITARKPPEVFGWMLEYLEGRFEPYDMEIKLRGGRNMRIKVREFKNFLGPDFLHKSTQHVYSLPNSVFEDYKSVWDVFCHRHTITIHPKWKLIGALKSNSLRVKYLLDGWSSHSHRERARDLGFILREAMRYMDRSHSVLPTRLLLLEMRKTMPEQKDWTIYKKSWMAAVSNSVLRHHRGIFNLLMTYVPQEGHPSSLVLRDLFADAFVEIWHLTRIYSLLAEYKTHRLYLKTCEHYFNSWGSLTWFETLVFLLQDSVLTIILRSNYAEKIAARLGVLIQPLTEEEKITGLQALEHSILTENSSVYQEIYHSLQISL
jgi:hypothetical protein